MQFLKKIAPAVFLLFSVYLLTSIGFAQEFTSADFKVIDPVISIPGGYSSSTDFQLFGAFTQIGIGTSTITNFGVNAGFLYYPFVTTPAVSAEAGDEQVTLTWTASEGFLGWSVGGYSVGQAIQSDGPYTYSSVGDVLTSVRSGLSNAVTYYFVVVVEDAFGNAIATSSEVSSVPVDDDDEEEEEEPPPGGGGGGPQPSGSRVTFKGRAYPESLVVVLRDGQLAVQTIAGPDAKFETALTGLGAGSYNFGVYGEDKIGRRSTIFGFPLTIAANSDTTISGIFLTPTIDVDKVEVRRGDDIGILGFTDPVAEVTISVNSHVEHFMTIQAEEDGSYFYNFDTTPLEIGEHTTKSKALADGFSSGFGQLVNFMVGDKNVAKEEVVLCPPRGDVNGDCRVNLVDFSIAAFWWERALTDAAKRTVDAKLWEDGVITLRDFSVMAFYWTG